MYTPYYNHSSSFWSAILLATMKVAVSHFSSLVVQLARSIGCLSHSFCVCTLIFVELLASQKNQDTYVFDIDWFSSYLCALLFGSIYIIHVTHQIDLWDVVKSSKEDIPGCWHSENATQTHTHTRTLSHRVCVSWSLDKLRLSLQLINSCIQQ